MPHRGCRASPANTFQNLYSICFYSIFTQSAKTPSSCIDVTKMRALLQSLLSPQLRSPEPYLSSYTGFCSTHREWSRWQRNTQSTLKRRHSHHLIQCQQVWDSSWRLSSSLSFCLLLVTCHKLLVWCENEKNSLPCKTKNSMCIFLHVCIDIYACVYTLIIKTHSNRHRILQNFG